MNKYEKELLKLLELHENIEKGDLINNLNLAIRQGGIKRAGKNQWVSKATGAPIGTVDAWFSRSDCRALNKIPLYAVCRIAIALHISIWKLYEATDINQKKQKKPDRRSRLYRYIQRNEAEKRWRECQSPEDGAWEVQSKEVQRDFLDQLYWESIEKQGKERQNG